MGGYVDGDEARTTLGIGGVVPDEYAVGGQRVEVKAELKGRIESLDERNRTRRVGAI